MEGAMSQRGQIERLSAAKKARILALLDQAEMIASRQRMNPNGIKEGDIVVDRWYRGRWRVKAIMGPWVIRGGPYMNAKVEEVEAGYFSFFDLADVDRAPYA